MVPKGLLVMMDWMGLQVRKVKLVQWVHLEMMEQKDRKVST